jgi:hypothetical protein
MTEKRNIAIILPTVHRKKANNEWRESLEIGGKFAERFIGNVRRVSLLIN